MDAEQWNDLADIVDFEPDKASATAAFNFLEKKVEGKGWTLSDLGCGPGSLTARLSPLFSRIRMVDFSEKMLERATREVTNYGSKNTETLLADMTAYQPEVKTDIAMACACPVFYRVGDAPKIERYASRACMIIMPTLYRGSHIFDILRQAGIDPVPKIDADLIIKDRSENHRCESVLFFEKKEELPAQALKGSLMRYAGGNQEYERSLGEVIDSLEEGERYTDRWSKIVYWELED